MSISKLKTGYTTGTCAAAAAKHAATSLVLGQAHHGSASTVTLPRGGTYGDSATLEISNCGFVSTEGRVDGEGAAKSAFAEVVKNAGDDPDVTNGAVIRAEVFWQDETTLPQIVIQNDTQNIYIEGGIGVGVVTRTGLPVAVGEAAINPVPRRMIFHEVGEVLQKYKIARAVRVVISVPDGEKIAALTMNPRLGIVGGISILGTRGVVIPFSSSAYRASLAVTIRAAAENGLRHLVLTTGGRSEKYAAGLYPQLDPMSFIEAGEFIGFSLKKCETMHVHKITLSGMMGKLSKVAAGVLMVHSSKSPVDFVFLSKIAEEAGADAALVEKIKTANTAGEVGEWMNGAGITGFFDLLTKRCCTVCHDKVQGKLDIETLLFSMDGRLLGRNAMAKSPS